SEESPDLSHMGTGGGYSWHWCIDPLAVLTGPAQFDKTCGCQAVLLFPDDSEMRRFDISPVAGPKVADQICSNQPRLTHAASSNSTYWFSRRRTYTFPE